MKTRVIHIKNKRGTPDEVYIGRPGAFGNPIAIGQICPECGQIHDRGGTLKCYRVYLERRLREPAFRTMVKDLYGKTLVCFCAPLPCHGNILAEYAEALQSE